MGRCGKSANGSALSAIISKRPKRKDNAGSAGAERQQHFVANVFLEIGEIERGLTLVAQHFQYGGTAFLAHLDAATFDIHNMHLQRLDQKVPVVAAVRTGQRHAPLPTPAQGVKKAPSRRSYVMAGAERNVKSSQMTPYQVFSEARGPHWIAWVMREDNGKPHRGVVVVAETQAKAEARARAWAEQTSY